MESASGPGITSYQQYGSTEGSGDFATVAFQQPSITTQPHHSMTGPERRHGYRQFGENNVIQNDFDVDCLNRLNRYFIENCIAPKEKAKHYNFITILNIVLCAFLCACCALPCLYLAYRESKNVKMLNNQRDYLSARSRSWIVVGCNITGFVFIILSDIAILATIIGLSVVLFHH